MRGPDGTQLPTVTATEIERALCLIGVYVTEDLQASELATGERLQCQGKTSY
jgi:hypothetical protein